MAITPLFGLDDEDRRRVPPDDLFRVGPQLELAPEHLAHRRDPVGLEPLEFGRGPSPSMLRPLRLSAADEDLA